MGKKQKAECRGGLVVKVVAGVLSKCGLNPSDEIKEEEEEEEEEEEGWLARQSTIEVDHCPPRSDL